MEEYPAMNPIKYYRKREDLTQDELAQKINRQRFQNKKLYRYEICKTHICYWENGKQAIPLRISMMMAEWLGISQKDFDTWLKRSFE